jgi:hypothetical protein
MITEIIHPLKNTLLREASFFNCFLKKNTVEIESKRGKHSKLIKFKLRRKVQRQFGIIGGTKNVITRTDKNVKTKSNV